jgi:hypothetical protein
MGDKLSTTQYRTSKDVKALVRSKEAGATNGFLAARKLA